MSILSSSPEGASGVTSIRVLRISRVTRLIRILRIARVVHFFVALRKLVFSMVHTMQSLAWSIILLSMIIYVYAILFSTAVAQHRLDMADAASDAASASEAVLDQYFGGLFTSAYTF